MMEFDLCEIMGPGGKHLIGDARITWAWRRIARDHGPSYCTLRNVAHISEAGELRVTKVCKKDKMEIIEALHFGESYQPLVCEKKASTTLHWMYR